MKKAEIQVVYLNNEIVTASGDPVCGCFEFGIVNPDSTNDEC